MITTAFVVEYNPFHNGHKLHLLEAKKITNATHCIGIMSGNFIQRGGPALIDKWNRAALAVENGVDLVIELPVLFASQSAELFAKGSVAILSKLNIIDNLVFGSESNDISELKSIAYELTIESSAFKLALKDFLKNGMTYPKARQEALKVVSDFNLSRNSNDILGIEYIKQIFLQNSTINPISIKRTGSTYNSEDLVGEICSATAIRQKLKHTFYTDLANFMPSINYNFIKSIFDNKSIVYDESFFPLIRYKIISSIEQTENIFDVSEGIQNRIYAAALVSSTLEELIVAVKSKRYTYTKIRRILFNILLDIKKEDMSLIKNSNSPAPYARILAFNDNGRQLLNQLKTTSDIPVINKVSTFSPITNLEKKCFDFDLKATRIYNLASSLSNSKDSLDLDYLKSPIYLR